MRISDWSSDVCSSDLGDVFEFLVRGDENHGAGSFVDLTALDAHETVLDDVETADALCACALVQFLNGFENRHRAAVDGDRADRKSGVEGKSVSVRGGLGGSWRIKKKKYRNKHE